MNAPIPTVTLRDTPDHLLQALTKRFDKQFSQAMVIREQHGRDESAFTHVPPPAGVVFAETTQDVQDAIRLAASAHVPVIPFGVGSSLEGHLLAVQGGGSNSHGPTRCHPYGR